jgi:two-component system OmpR family response regulator
MTEILLIEDDQEIIDILTTYLARYDMHVTGYTNPLQALDALKIDTYDLTILDLSLPDMDGLDVCKILTTQFNLPVVISSARSDVSDRVLGLELGADDYLPKPYEPRELVARIQSVLRRHKGAQQPPSVFHVDEARMIITQNNTPLQFTRAEFEVFSLFLAQPNHVLSREFIANNVDAISWESSDKSIDVIIGRIRQKIGDSDKPAKHIITVRGVGYKYVD